MSCTEKQVWEHLTASSHVFLWFLSVESSHIFINRADTKRVSDMKSLQLLMVISSMFLSLALGVNVEPMRELLVREYVET